MKILPLFLNSANRWEQRITTNDDQHIAAFSATKKKAVVENVQKYLVGLKANGYNK